MSNPVAIKAFSVLMRPSSLMGMCRDELLNWVKLKLWWCCFYLAVHVHLQDLLILIVHKQGCLQTFQYHMTWFCTNFFRIVCDWFFDWTVFFEFFNHSFQWLYWHVTWPPKCFKSLQCLVFYDCWIFLIQSIEINDYNICTIFVCNAILWNFR